MVGPELNSQGMILWPCEAWKVMESGRFLHVFGRRWAVSFPWNPPEMGTLQGKCDYGTLQKNSSMWRKLTICRSSSQGNHWFSTPVFVCPSICFLCTPDANPSRTTQRTTVCRCSRLIAGLCLIIIHSVVCFAEHGELMVNIGWSDVDGVWGSWFQHVLTCFNYSVSIVFWTPAIQMMIQQDYETVKLT